MILLLWETIDDEVATIQNTIQYKMKFAGIKSFYCHRAESQNLDANGQLKIICIHGFSDNIRSKAVNWTVEHGKRLKYPKQNPTSDPETNKEDFTAMESANYKLKKLVKDLGGAVDDA